MPCAPGRKPTSRQSTLLACSSMNLPENQAQSDHNRTTFRCHLRGRANSPDQNGRSVTGRLLATSQIDSWPQSQFHPFWWDTLTAWESYGAHLGGYGVDIDPMQARRAGGLVPSRFLPTASA